MSTPGASARSPLDTLRRIRGSRPQVAPGERCEMCAEPVGEEHQHVVDVQNRSLMCTCRGCYLLFTDQQAALRYRSVPDRYLSLPGFTLRQADWEELQIPVELVFVFANSVQDRVVAFYPSPAGATESELSLSAWDRVVQTNPALALLAPDVEAVLIRGGREQRGFAAWVVPIDACYELVGRMRQTWRGFDGGQEARATMQDFFETVQRRSRPAGVAS